MENHLFKIRVLFVLLIGAVVLWAVKFDVLSEHRDAPPVSPNDLGNQEVFQEKPRLVDGPEPDTFEQFNLPSKRLIERNVLCSDQFYTLLLFPAGIDYRISPRSAVYNTASPCAKGERLKAVILFKDISAPAGEYYLVIADQGDGLWYNPR